MAKYPRSLLLLLSLMAVACGFPKSGPVPGPVSPTSAASAATKWPGTTEQSLEAGRTTFTAKCNACHSHPDVKAISEEKWPGILDEMAKKADLTPAQKSDVLHFVITARSEGAAAAKP